jgi:hypothetical protein
MNDEATDLDQADEEILTYTVSDEALEAAASTITFNYSLGCTCTICFTEHHCP